jgi:hypothetical protein
MFSLGLVLLVLSVGAFALLGRSRPRGEVGAAARLLGLGATGLVVLWAVVSIATMLFEDRHLSDWRDERALLERSPIPVSEVEIIEPTFVPGTRAPSLQGWLRNKSARTLYAIDFRWSIPWCRTPDDCHPVGWRCDQRIDNGLRPGQMVPWRVDLLSNELSQEMTALGMRQWPTEKTPARIEVLAGRGL